MESAQKTQLSDLRQKRLAYFDQRYPPSPPLKPKPSDINLPSKSKTNGQVERDGYKTHLNYGSTSYSKTGAIPKSQKNTYRYNNSLDVNRNSHVQDSLSCNKKESNGFSYQQVAEKRRSTNEMLTSQEFEISTDVEELFQTHRERSKPLRNVPREKPDQDFLTENSFETASTDYENQLRNHIQRPERYSINNQIKKSQVLLMEGEDNPIDLRDVLNSRDHVDSRKKHLKKYIYRQEDKVTTSAVKAAGDHNAVYAQNILHQMNQVRHVKEQVHEQLMSCFSQQELRLKPTNKIKQEQERTSSNEVGSMFASRLSDLDRNGRKPWQQPAEEVQHSDIATTTGLPQMSSFQVSEPVLPSLNHSSILKNGDNVYDCHNVLQEELPDSFEDDMTFDLGALQEAANLGDDILRKYIQSLSKNLKKKKDTLTSQNYVKTDLGDGEYDNDQCLPSEMVSHNVRSTKTNLRVDAKKNEQYKPKVSQPSVTSVELETLGLFDDLKSNMHHSSAHDAEDLDIHSIYCQDQGVRLKGNVEENSNEDVDLGFRTHRPQERSFSPLKQIHMFNDIRQSHDQDKQMYSTGSDVIDDCHNLGGLTEHELSINKDDGEHKQVDLSFHDSDSCNGQNIEAVDDDIDCFFSADANKNCHTLEKEQSRADHAGVEELKDKTNPVPSFSNGQPISDPKTTDIISSTPFPHPPGTEIGNFLCSGQSTDSDQDPLIKNSSLKPKPPQDEKKSTNIKCRRPKNLTEVPVKNKSPRRPKTPERHINGVREHHEKRRDNRRQLSSRKSPSQQSPLRDIRETTSPEHGRENNSNKCLELNEASLKNYDHLKVDDIFRTSHWQGSEKPVDVFQDGVNHVSIGPAGDAPQNINLQNQTVKLCPVCNSFDKDVYSKCEVCSTNFLDISTNPVDLHIPSLIDKLGFSLPAVSERTDLMSGSAWDIEVTDQRHDGNVQRNGEDNESTVMGKISMFVPKSTTHGGGDFLADPDGVAHGNQLDERGVGDGREVTGNLPDRVNAWLADNETGRLSHDANNPSRLNIHENHHSDESVEGLAAQGVTFDLPQQSDLLRENGKMSGSDEHLVKIKPRPSSAGPQRSRQVPIRPKSSISKSRTGQLIDQPMYNRRWATSSATWGSRRSVGESLQVGGQRSPMIESITTSSSPITQRKRPSSAKHGTPPRKSDIEQGVRGQRSRPKSANWKSRDSKDLKEGMNQDMKETFLAVNSAQLKGTVYIIALNIHTNILGAIHFGDIRKADVVIIKYIMPPFCSMQSLFCFVPPFQSPGIRPLNK